MKSNRQKLNPRPFNVTNVCGLLPIALGTWDGGHAPYLLNSRHGAMHAERPVIWDGHAAEVTQRDDTVLVIYTVLRKKDPPIFDYSSRVSWSIFITLAPVERGMNTSQYHVIYLLNCLMAS